MTTPAPRPQRTLIAGPAGPLELLFEPVVGDARAVVLICHPHPLHGGTLDNKVVHALARAAMDCAAHALRFNFRGVGASGGTHDAGRGEVDDLLAAATWARAAAPGLPVHLAGFSFGSAVALAGVAPVGARSVLLVAPPVGRIAVAGADAAGVPLAVIHGDADTLIGLEDVRAWAGAAALTVIPGAEHFFHGKLRELKDAARAFWTAQADLA